MLATEWIFVIGHLICMIGFIAAGVFMMLPRPVMSEVHAVASLRRIAGVNMLFWAMSHLVTILLVVFSHGSLDPAFSRSFSMVVDLLVVPGVVYMVMSLMSCHRNLVWIVLVQIVPAICIVIAYCLTREFSFAKISACYWTAYVGFFLVLYMVLEYSFRYYHLELLDVEHAELVRLRYLLLIFTVYFALYGTSVWLGNTWYSVLVAFSELLVWGLVARHIETMRVQIDFWEMDDLGPQEMKQLLQRKYGIVEQPIDEPVEEAVAELESAKSSKSAKLDWMGELLQREFIDKQLFLRQDLTLDTMAHLLKTNRTYINSYLAQTGLSYYDFLNLHRIDHARKMIEDGETSMVMVARTSGYISDTTFRRAFRAQMGCLPSEYMATCKSKDDKKDKKEVK